MACMVLHNVIIENERPNVDEIEPMDEAISRNYSIKSEVQGRTTSQREEAKRKKIELTTLISASKQIEEIS